LSLIPHLLDQIWTVTGGRSGINYGLNRLRFPAPVPVGSRIRANGKLDSAEDITGGIQVQISVTIEVEGKPKPACVAEVIYRYYTRGVAPGSWPA
jgi:acyl dehydratase